MYTLCSPVVTNRSRSSPSCPGLAHPPPPPSSHNPLQIFDSTATQPSLCLFHRHPSIRFRILNETPPRVNQRFPIEQRTFDFGYCRQDLPHDRSRRTPECRKIVAHQHPETLEGLLSRSHTGMDERSSRSRPREGSPRARLPRSRRRGSRRARECAQGYGQGRGRS